MPRRIRHLAISSQHPGKAAAFYKEAFGFEELNRFNLAPDDDGADGTEAPRPSGVIMTDGHINIAILKFNEDQIGKSLEFEGLHHIGVVVDDLDAWTEKLEGMGAPCIAGEDAIPPGAHYEIKFRGPDDVVFDISPLPWPGSEDATEKEVAE